MLGHREVRAGVGAAVTDRFGGVSQAPYDELNLADHVGDDPAAVAENRRRVLEAVLPGGALATMRQVHGNDVAIVQAADVVPEVDALVTRAPGLVLAVQVADCTPVLLWDSEAGVVAAVHAGRRGLAAGVVPRTIAVMTELHARPERMNALVGPGICAEHYEVPAELRDEVEAAVPGTAAETSSGTPALDIRAGVLAQLRAGGLRQWSVMSQCTAESPHLYSYRRDGTTGRFAGLVWIEP